MRRKVTLEEYKNRPFAKGADELGFLFYIKSIPAHAIYEWLRVQDFVDEMLRLKKCGIYITVEVLYSVMNPIMQDIKEYGIHSEDIQRDVMYGSLHNGLKDVKKSLGFRYDPELKQWIPPSGFQDQT